MNTFAVNERNYNPPSRPIVVVCLDGSADEYLDAALLSGRMPHLEKICRAGYRGLARAAMPTFTNVNNASIVTGVPPDCHGIVGNYFYDTESGTEVMMNSSKFLRAETIFPAAQRAGRKVAVVTAKEKLRDIFASGLTNLGGIAFSSERANAAVLGTHGIEQLEKLIGPSPPIYSAEASIYVFKAGVKLIEEGLADFLYLSTTDYMQHKFGPDAPEALEFYGCIDEQLGRLQDMGALLGITADHGMNAKQKPDGSPNVIYLETELANKFGPGFRVILPITDPYIAHHGALGSFAQVHVPVHERKSLPLVMDFVQQMAGITEVLQKSAASRLMELPSDRMGDFVVCAGRNVVLGRAAEWHDLSALEGGLRSHGGRYEEMVPFVLNKPLRPVYAARARGDLRNFDLFDFTCNGTV